MNRPMKVPNKRNQHGIVLVITLMFTLIAAIGAAAFLHLTKTQIVQVRLQSHSTKAFYAAEVGLEKAVKLLKNDFYYTPEEMEPSWADDKIFSATGYIDLTRDGQVYVPKYLNLDNPDYVNDFYPLLNETVYESTGSGAYKSTYQIHLSNLIGWTDRIWVKTTGKYYRRNEAGTDFILEETRSILALLRAREISPWNNAIFAGDGASGGVICGNAEIRGSVHLLGTSLGSDDLAADFSGNAEIGNNYSGVPTDQSQSGIPPELGTRVPSIEKTYGGETVDSLEAEVRIRQGKLGLSGFASAGHPDVPGNVVKERLEGVYITDGYGGDQGEGNVHSDNGTGNPYDLDGFDIEFPRLSERYGSYPTYLDYLRANALVIESPQDLNQLQNIDPTSSFSFSSDKGEISMDGNGRMTIRGIVVVEGDVNFNKKGPEKEITYQGKGSLVSASSVGINCSLLTFSFSTYPKVDILGVMAADEITFDTPQLNVMGVFYAENQIVSEKQTSVAGTFFSNYFDMGNEVPAIYQVPETVGNLPDGMIGDFRIWVIKRITWGEIPSGACIQAIEEAG